MMRIKNPAKLQAALKAATLVAIQREVLPVFRAGIYLSARFLITPDEGYEGTPQWTGNAAANWYLARGRGRTGYVDYFPEIPNVIDAYSASEDPNESAVRMSLRRVRGALMEVGIQNTKVSLYNPTPYLAEYRPYGGSETFRMTNSPAATVDRAALKLRREFSSVTKLKASKYKSEWGV